jgi:CBS domain-containing protein
VDIARLLRSSVSARSSFQPQQNLIGSSSDSTDEVVRLAHTQTSRQRASPEDDMAKLARDVMTQDPACCSPGTTLDQVAKMMVENNCGEIPIVDRSNHPIGVVTDRDIVCRVVAEGKNPSGQTADSCMTRRVVTVPADAPVDEVIATMEDYQIRRVPVVDDVGCCAGIIAQADIAANEPPRKTAELVCEISRDMGRPSLTLD